MRKFKLLLAVMVVVGMYACNGGATDGTEGTTTPADTTQTQVEEDHTGHDH